MEAAKPTATDDLIMFCDVLARLLNYPAGELLRARVLMPDLSNPQSKPLTCGFNAVMRMAVRDMQMKAREVAAAADPVMARKEVADENHRAARATIEGVEVV